MTNAATQQSKDGRPHGAFGIVSFAVAFIAASLGILNYAMLVAVGLLKQDSVLVSATIGSIFQMCWLMDLLAIGLGLAGVRDKTSKPNLSAIGIAIAACTIVLSVIVIVQRVAAAR